MSDPAWCFLTSAQQRIKKLEFDIIAILPELMLDNHFLDLWKCPKFYNGVRRIIIDEAHCIETWGGSFRPPYKQLACLNCILAAQAPQIQWFLTSATLSPDMVSNVLTTLEMPSYTFDPKKEGKALWMQCLTDCPNLYYIARPMMASAKSFHDLGFLVPEGLHSSDPRPCPFLVYCNKRSETEDGVKYLRS